MHAGQRPIVLHADLHGGNLKWHAGRLAVFDLDDAGFGVPALDLAISTFYLRDGDPRSSSPAPGLREVRTLPEVSAEQFEALVAAGELLLANSLLLSSTASLRAEATAYLDVTVQRLREWLDTGRFVRGADPLTRAGCRQPVARDLRRSRVHPLDTLVSGRPRGPAPRHRQEFQPCLPRSPSTSRGASDRCRSRPRPAHSSTATAPCRRPGQRRARDLAHVLADGDVVEPVTAAEQDGLDVLRHSAAHVLAQAVQEVHPDAKLGIGPPIRDGFYYDFDVETPFTPEDLKALEKAMQRIINEGQTFHRRVITDDDARASSLASPTSRADRPQGRCVRTAAEGRPPRSAAPS